jgi:hypothetical protein
MSHIILTTHSPVFLVISLLTRVYKSLLLLYINCWLLMSCYVIVLASTISMLFMIFKLLALNTNQSINLLFVVDHEIQYIYIYFISWRKKIFFRCLITYMCSIYYMLFSYQTGYIMWHSRLRLYIPWGALYTLSDGWITDILQI